MVVVLNPSLITAGSIGVGVNFGVEVIVGVGVIDGVWVIVGVSVWVGCRVVVGEGTKNRYTIGSVYRLKAKANPMMMMPTRMNNHIRCKSCCLLMKK